MKQNHPLCGFWALGALFAALAMTAEPAVVVAQTAEKYPARPIEFIVPWGAGGGSDQTGRQISKMLEAELNVSFPVVNSPGGTGTAGMAKMLAAPADGYTISIMAWDTLAVLATRQQKWGLNDIIPLAIVIQLPSGFYVAESGRFKTWTDVEKEAKAKPNTLKVAISGFGSPDHITVDYLATKGLAFKMVPFAEPGERYSNVLGGHAELLYSPVGNVQSFVDGKQMRPILFFTAEKLPAFADVPSSKQSGYDITLSQRRAVVVRAGTPPDRVKILSDALAKVTAQPAYAEYLKRSSAQSDSYVGGKGAVNIMERDLEDMKRISQK